MPYDRPLVLAAALKQSAATLIYRFRACLARQGMMKIGRVGLALIICTGWDA